MDKEWIVNTYFENLKAAMDKIEREKIKEVFHLLTDAYERNKKIIVMGNGGSGATASHMVAEFNKVLSYGHERRFRVICLNDNIPTILAYGNDVSFDDIFVEQLKNFLDEGDVVIGFTTSGTSKNVIKALKFAKERGNKTVGFVGFDGGEVKNIVDLLIHVPVHDTQISEDIHLSIIHILMRFFMDYLNPLNSQGYPVNRS